MISIRTQDRMSLVPYDKRINISKVWTKNYKYEDVETNFAEINCGGYPLGEYSSKERALEVLDEIEKANRDNKVILYEYFSGDVEYTFPKQTEYQMPKE